MTKFDKIIGYETIKTEFEQICDMIHNKEIYIALGAKMPHGLLLYGNPGLGKTLMAKCFIEESGLKAYTVRRNKGTDDFVGEITETFKQAKENAPAIVFLDDMDKFANEDEDRRDAEEYVSIQSGIDEVKDSEVFVIGTANNIRKLPQSLTRSGRFDRKIEVCSPSPTDAFKIIRHYLKDKKIADDLNLEDIAMMIRYNSCAELETILNEAAILAAYARRERITMKDMVNAVLRMEYEAPDSFTKTSEDDMRRIALHEAGHLVICEVLCSGSVGLASLRSSGRDSMGGFVRRCKELTRSPFDILFSLGGKAAVELYYADAHASGCHTDMKRAAEQIRTAITESCVSGFGYMDIENRFTPGMSENLNSRNEAVVHSELERYLLKAKDILLKNKVFLEKVTAALIEKETLLYSDIKALRESVSVIEIAV